MPRWLLILAAVVLLASPAAADYVTPDSILRPPPETYAGVQGTPTYVWLDAEYAGIGLRFPTWPQGGGFGTTWGTVVASVHGQTVWAPATNSTDFFDPLAGYRPSIVDFNGRIDAELTRPASALAVDFVWQAGEAANLRLGAYRADYTFTEIDVVDDSGSRRITLDEGDYIGFGAAVWYAGPVDSLIIRPVVWGIAGVELTPTPVQTAPEPGTLALAALGIFGLCVRRLRRPG